MPMTHFKCPDSAPSAGEAHTFEHCISECQHRCLSPYLIAAVASSNQRNHHRGKYVSATSLTGCVRKLRLERTVDYALEPKLALYPYRGTVMHTVVEDATTWAGFGDKTLTDLGFLSEWNMKVGFCFDHGGFPLPDGVDATDQETWAQVECPACYEANVPLDKQDWFVLGGTLDGAEPLWNGRDDGVPPFDPETGVLYMVLHDLKTMKDYAIGKFVMGDSEATLHTHAKDDYFVQAQIYRYLAEASIPPESLRKKGVKQIKFVEARLQAFAMGEFPYMGSQYTYRSGFGKNAKIATYDIPVMTFQPKPWVEDFIRERGRPIYESLVMETTLGSVCEPDSKPGRHSWKCDFCAFLGSAACPNPSVEYIAAGEGMSPKDAYRLALSQQLD
jgi:hypothetical protein